jgi:DNA-binding transcriptional LysR family regulator
MGRSTINFEDILAFDCVVESGIFVQASRRLGISKSIVSRRVARLESTLGARLVLRGAQGAAPTQVGEDYRQRLKEILSELEVAHEAVHQAVAQIAGSIRLTAPVGFGVDHLVPVLAEFLIAHPDIEIDLVLEDRRVDLLAERFDLALRIGDLQDSSLVARRLGPVRTVVAASPLYLARRGRPEHPHDLIGHDAVLYAPLGSVVDWRFKVNGHWEKVPVDGRFRANNGRAICEMAEAGLGVAVLPVFVASASLADGRLESILTDWPLTEYGLYAVMPPSRAATARVRALMDHLVSSFRQWPG